MNYKRKRYLLKYRRTHKIYLRKYRKQYEKKNWKRIYKYRKAYKKKYQKQHPIKHYRSVRNSELMRNFGITRKQYIEKLHNQNNHCAICPTTVRQNGKDLAVDHCHKSNKNRGLLCSQCNVGLGYFKDSPERLKSAIRYLSLFHRH